jgi:metalloendopeptidase OMA1, mitochondrial
LGVVRTCAMRRYAVRLIPVAIALVVIWVQFISSEKIVNEAGREVRLALSPKEESALGLQSYRQVLNQSRVIQSGPKVELVKGVAARLASATADAGRNFDWEVSVVDDPQVNAFCLPGGKIVVYTGILPVTQSDAGLATVMGHEMGHATLRHGSERLLKQKTTDTLLTGVQFSLGDMSYDQQRAIMGAIGAGAQYGFLLPFSREHESEADKVGLFYMAKAGYDPRESIAFWERMSKASARGQPMEFMSTHPSNGTRIEQLKALLPQAMALYHPQLER